MVSCGDSELSKYVSEKGCDVEADVKSEDMTKDIDRKAFKAKKECFVCVPGMWQKLIFLEQHDPEFIPADTHKKSVTWISSPELVGHPSVLRDADLEA